MRVDLGRGRAQVRHLRVDVRGARRPLACAAARRWRRCEHGPTGAPSRCRDRPGRGPRPRGPDLPRTTAIGTAGSGPGWSSSSEHPAQRSWPASRSEPRACAVRRSRQLISMSSLLQNARMVVIRASSSRSSRRSARGCRSGRRPADELELEGRLPLGHPRRHESALLLERLDRGVELVYRLPGGPSRRCRRGPDGGALGVEREDLVGGALADQVDVALDGLEDSVSISHVSPSVTEKLVRTNELSKCRTCSRSGQGSCRPSTEEGAGRGRGDTPIVPPRTPRRRPRLDAAEQVEQHAEGEEHASDLAGLLERQHHEVRRGPRPPSATNPLNISTTTAPPK